MVKEKKVKWALGGSEPEDLAEFKDNDQIVKEHTKKGETNWPPRGSTVRCLVRQIKVKPNKNGDDRLSVMLVIDEPKKSDMASWNNYAMFDGFNVTEQGSPFIKRFLKAMGLTWKDFMDRTKQDDQDPPHITQIGKVQFEGAAKPVHVECRIKVKPADDYHDAEFIDPTGYIAKETADDSDDSDDSSGEKITKPAKEGKAGKKGKKGKGKKGNPDDPPF